jgi:signal peptidase II
MTTDDHREDDRRSEPADNRAGDRPAGAGDAAGEAPASVDAAEAATAAGPPVTGDTDHGAATERSARWPLLLGVAAGVLAVDQLSKAWAVEALGDGRTIELVGSLRLQLTMNYGSAFSLADGRGPLISLLALVVVAVLLRSGRHATRPATAVALGLVLGGAIGNLIDRAFRAGDGFLGGGVVDFIDLQWWPVFNVADSAIVVGAILLFIVQWREAEPDGSAAGDR